MSKNRVEDSVKTTPENQVESAGSPKGRGVVKGLLRGFLVLTTLLVALWCVAVALIASPEFLTPRVRAIAQQSVKSDFSLKSVDVSLFDRFPNITLRIDSLSIAQTKDSISDLLFARECRVAVDPVALLFKKVVVNNLELRDAQIYIYVDSLHGPLKTFNLPTESPEKSESDTTSMDLSSYSLLLRRVKLDSIQLIINDRNRDFYTRVENFGLDMSMSLSSQVSKLDLETSFSNFIVWHKGDVLVRKTSMSVDSDVLLDLDSLKLSFNKADVRLNGIDLKSSGVLHRDTLSGNLDVDVQASLNTPSLSEFLALVPSVIVSDKEKITTRGSVDLDLKIKGQYGDDVLPTVAATIKVDDATARYASRKVSLESVNCDAEMFLDLNNPKSSYADIKNLYVNTSGILTFGVKGRVTDLIENPIVDISVKSDIDFDRFSEVFPLNEGVVCSGVNHSDITMKFVLSDLMKSNFAKLQVDGESTFKDMSLIFDMSKFEQDSSSMASLHMQVREGKMLFGDKVAKSNANSSLRAKINFSGLGYKSKSGEFVDIKDIELAGGASFDKKTSTIRGYGFRGVARNSNVGIDSLFNATLESSDLYFVVVPEVDGEQRVDMNISSEHITANEPIYNSMLSLSSVDMDFTARRSEGERWKLSGDVGFSDFKMYTDLFPIDITIPKSAVAVNEGTIYLTNAELTMGRSELVATGHINNLMRKLFVDPRLALSGELSITSPTMDVTELIETSNKSFILLEEMTSSASTTGGTADSLAATTSVSIVDATQGQKSTQQKDTLIAENVTPEAVNTPEATSNSIVEASQSADVQQDGEQSELGDTLSRGHKGRGKGKGGDRPHRDSLRRGPVTQSNTIFLVPRRVDFVFDLNVEKAIFEDAEIKDVAGRATIKRGILSLDKLNLKAIGADATGSMIYRNVDSRSSNIAINMELMGVDINRIGELVPSVGSMLPMLESFEGSVDFYIKANTNLVDDAEIDVSTLRSAMYFKGRNLVLMDSETFNDLSKTLMFKNKKRNLIDELEVYALVDKDKIDVLPFPITIDRYKAIVGGSQIVDPATFDVDYKYNISIMKSPLPFKAGVDVAGNLEDFKFKITTAKLKNTNFEEQREKYEQYRDSIK